MTLPGRPAADMRRRGPRPERYLLPVSGAAVLFAIWLAVAHASGSGWVQALAAVAAAAALVGLAGPRFALGSLELEVEESPREAVSGGEIGVVVVATRPCRCTPLRPEGRPVLLRRGKPSELAFVPAHRGVLGAVLVEVSSAAPFGLLWWSVRRRLELPAAVTISPVAAREGVGLAQQGRGDEGDVGTSAPSLTGELRGVREYRLGDSPRLVHWRATAHTGTLMTREHESDARSTVHLVAHLADDPDVAEVEASALLARVSDHLHSGSRVVLETTEGGVRVEADVPDAAAAGRRLARAGRNPWDDLGPVT